MRTLPLLLLLASIACGEPMAYRFSAGTELRFEGVGTAAGAEVRSKCRAWTLRRNPDGTFRVACCLVSKEGDRPLWWYGDLSPDGSYEPNETTNSGFEPGEVFPLLPHPDRAPRKFGVLTFRYATSDPGVVTFTVESPESAVFGVHESFRLTLKDGLPAAVEKTIRSGGAIRARGVLRLVHREIHDGAWMKRFGDEVESYFDVRRRYEETLDPARLREMLARTTLGEIRRDLQARLDEHEERAAFEKKRKETQARFLGKPSASWETKDFDGRRYALSDFRGKVVVLDFWFRRCGWCVHEMPDIEEISRRYQGKPVAVLGMNVDRRAEDARFAMKALGLSYPNLEARGIRDLYGVLGYPTVVVLDKRGVVRRIQHGAWFKLRRELPALIDKLLSETE